MSLRSRLERTPDEEAPPKVIERDRRRPSYGEHAAVTRTRDRDIVRAVTSPPKSEHEKWQDYYWAKYKREEKATKDAAIEKERQRQEALKQERQRNNSAALKEFELQQVEQVLIDCSVTESQAIASLVKRKYKDSVVDPTAWSLAKDEVRSETRARAEFSQMPLEEVDAINEDSTELAKRLRCDVAFAAKLLNDHWYGNS
jgi:flagellar biosynthesis GTPase FlhF